MKLSLFDYNLPSKLIANKPANPRDSAKLLVYDKTTDQVVHDTFLHLDKYLQKGDVLVFNDSKVFPARLFGQKTTSGKVEILLLKQLSESTWEIMVKTKKAKADLEIIFSTKLKGVLQKKLSAKTWQIQFNLKNQAFINQIEKIGKMPLPPYIKSQESETKLKSKYQTVYANKIGSAAAPTAGLHFTNRLLQKLKNKGIKIKYITLHVGLGTFSPVDTENIEDYQIHSEWVEVKQKTLLEIKQAKAKGQRIVAVGTTSIRTLEAIFSSNYDFKQDFRDNVNIYIYPGYKFQIVDAIITNFHIPKSSLLMLISAFLTRTKILKLYQIAIKKKYKFYSFGDGMFLK